MRARLVAFIVTLGLFSMALPALDLAVDVGKLAVQEAVVADPDNTPGWYRLMLSFLGAFIAEETREPEPLEPIPCHEPTTPEEPDEGGAATPEDPS